MKFISSSANLRFVVRSHRQSFDQVSGRVIDYPGLAAQFTGGQFDSELTAKRHGWTEEDRKEVEEKILASDEFNSIQAKATPGHPRIYLAVDEGPQTSATKVKVKQGRKTTADNDAGCTYYNSETGLCGKPVVGQDLCEDHLNELNPQAAEAAVAG